MNGSNLIGRYLRISSGPFHDEIFIVRDVFSSKDTIGLIVYGVIYQKMNDINANDIYKYNELFAEQLDDGTTLIHDYDKIVSTLNGFLHCESGPAVRFFDTSKKKNIYAIKSIKFSNKAQYFESLTDEQKEKVIWNLDMF